MTENNQPVAVLAMLIDAAGSTQIVFRRYHDTTGRQMMSDTIQAVGITETMRRLEELLATAFTTPLKLATRPSATAEPNTRQLPCGCIITTTGTGALRECESHKEARRHRAADQERRAQR